MFFIPSDSSLVYQVEGYLGSPEIKGGSKPIRSGIGMVIALMKCLIYSLLAS
jgi:hypothetical protein